jgi:chaperonin GroES
MPVSEGECPRKYLNRLISPSQAHLDQIHILGTKGELSVMLVDAPDNLSPDRSEEETDGGILIAKSSKSDSKPSTGEVIKVGPGKIASDGKLMPMDVAVGDKVKFRDFAGNEVEIGEMEFSVVKMSDVLAKF